MLKHLFQDGSDSEAESMEEERKSEHETFLFSDLPNDKTESLSFENTQPAPASGQAQVHASSASIVAPADISIFDGNTIINGESEISSEDNGDLWTWQLLAVHSVYTSPRSCCCVCVRVCVYTRVCVCADVCSRRMC